MAHIKPEQLRSGFYEITGSLYGTASFAISASHVDEAVVTASAINDTITFTKGDGSTFPITLTSIATASYALNALSSSYALTASYAANVPLTSSYALYALSSSYALTASYVNSLGSSNYTQSFTNQSTWTVIHNLNTRYVIVQVYDTAFDEIIPQNIDLTDDNTVTITFPTLESGTAVVTVGGALQNSGAVSSSYAFNATSASYALTASYINPTFISASAAAAGFGSGGGSVTVPGSNTQILFNSASALGASQYFKFNYDLGSLSQGDTTTPSGQYSHAEGRFTTALGSFSHAEGNFTSATGDGAHSEGNFTLAVGTYSHTEGFETLAFGFSSHAEGQGTTSSGEFSHAEGLKTVSSGNGSHAEGYFTTSSGNYSHAEGNNTVASALYQPAQGTYNIASNITGAFIHGNGNSSTRSNLIFAAGNTVQITGSLVVTGSLIVTGSTQGNVAALTISSNTASVDLTRASFFTITLTSGVTTHISASNIQPGTTSTILVTTDGTSNVSFPSNIKQPSGSFYTASAVSAKDILTFISYDSTNLYLASVKNLI